VCRGDTNSGCAECHRRFRHCLSFCFGGLYGPPLLQGTAVDYGCCFVCVECACWQPRSSSCFCGIGLCMLLLLGCGLLYVKPPLMHACTLRSAYSTIHSSAVVLLAPYSCNLLPVGPCCRWPQFSSFAAPHTGPFSDSDICAGGQNWQLSGV
jgi:hypothetical protein